MSLDKVAVDTVGIVNNTDRTLGAIRDAYAYLRVKMTEYTSGALPVVNVGGHTA